MTTPNITPEDIARVAEWLGLEDVRIVTASGDVGGGLKALPIRHVIYDTSTYGENSVIPSSATFDPINNGADAWRVLDHCARLKLTPEFNSDYLVAGKDTFGVCLCVDAHGTTCNLSGPRADTPAEALLLAVLKMIGDSE